MKKEVLKKFITEKEIGKVFNILDGVSKEHNMDMKSLNTIEDDNFGQLKYIASTVKNGIVHTNWLLSENDKKYGICYCRGGSTEIKKYVDNKYLEFRRFHHCLWLFLCEDMTYDLVYKGNVILSKIISYDLIGLSNQINFLQIDTKLNRYLFCIELDDINDGIFSPMDLNDLRQWFLNSVIKRGYEGMLDDLCISDIIRIYFEVQNCIFSVGNFKPFVL